jgi:hypothetical protein
MEMHAFESRSELELGLGHAMHACHMPPQQLAGVCMQVHSVQSGAQYGMYSSK